MLHSQNSVEILNVQSFRKHYGLYFCFSFHSTIRTGKSYYSYKHVLLYHCKSSLSEVQIRHTVAYRRCE